MMFTRVEMGALLACSVIAFSEVTLAQRQEPAAIEQAGTPAKSYVAYLLEQAERQLSATGDSRNAEVAALMLREAAQAGLPRAMVLLAGLLTTGDGVDPDPREASALLERALAAGLVADAALGLGDLYSSDTDIRDLARAVEAYRTAGDAGNAMALMRLGMVLAAGEDIEPDPQEATAALEKAIALGLDAANLEAIGDLYGSDSSVHDAARSVSAYQAAVDVGSTSSAIKLAELLVAGGEIEADPDRAVELLNAAIASGAVLPAAEMLAEIYSSPNGRQDLPRAAEAYAIAADAGSTEAMLALAEILTSGNGVPQDPQRARELIQGAIDAGELADGWEALGAFYRADTAVRDPVRALDAYEKAAEAGSTWAIVLIGRMVASGEGLRSPDPERAIALFEAAIKADRAASAGESLGDLYLDLPPPQNLAAAAEAYRVSAENGNPSSMIKLARMLVTGKGVEADAAGAIVLLERAIAAGTPIPAAKTLIEIYTSDTPFNDPAKAAAAYGVAAEAGDAEAMIGLGDILLNGRGVAADPQRAAELLQAAIDAGETAEAARALGQLYLSGTGIFDPAKAADAFRQAVDAGNAEAMVSLAKLLIAGEGVAQDLEQARSLLEQAVQDEDLAATGAASMLGKLYRNAPFDDPTRAATAYRIGAAAGDAESMWRLGEMLAAGDGVEMDREQAADLLDDALDSGQAAEAGVALAELYLMDAPLRDPNAAAEAYQDAIDAGSRTAMLALAQMVLDGEGIPRDPERAVDLLDQLADAGDVLPAARILGDIYTSDPALRDIARAVSAYEAAVAAGDAEAMISLASLLVADEGIPTDPQRAIQLLEQAAASGPTAARARELLGDLYLAEGPMQNAERAIVVYEHAIESGSSSALTSLARMLFAGVGVPPQPERAIALLEQAATDGDGAAAFMLADYYLARRQHGDAERAADYLTQAAAAGYGPAHLALADQAGDSYRDPAGRQAILEHLAKAASAGATDTAAAKMMTYPVDKLIMLTQELLRSLGYGVGIDGSFGPRTENALRQFCASAGIEDCVTAFVTRDILQALLLAMAER